MPRFVGAFAPRRRRTGTPRIRWLILFLTVCVAIGGSVRWEYLRYLGRKRSRRRRRQAAEKAAERAVAAAQKAALDRPNATTHPLVHQPNYPCVYAKWPGGWGNVVYRVLHALIVTSSSTADQQPRTFSCIQGYGGLMADMFVHVERCPPDWNAEERCLWTGGEKEIGPRDVEMEDVRRFLMVHLEDYPELLKLNATFVNQVFRQVHAPYTTRDLASQACATHVRFGDVHSRTDATMDAANRNLTAHSKGRACKTEIGGRVEDCFPLIRGKVEGACPDLDTPIYLAADYTPFVHWFCQQESLANTGQRFLNACAPRAGEDVHHISDVGVPLIHEEDGYSVDPRGLPTLLATLADWLTLALTDQITGIGHSTFSETASFPFYVQEPEQTQHSFEDYYLWY